MNLTWEVRTGLIKHRRNADGTPVAAAAAERVLTLPIYGDLSLADADAVCDELLKGAKS